MTYQIREGADADELVNESGDVIATINHPVTVPDDIIDAILDDMGVGSPQKAAFKVLFTGDWEYVTTEEQQA